MMLGRHPAARTRRETGDKQGEIGPRALRSILFRYQLARLILEELGVKDWNPALLARMIVDGH